MMGEYWFTVGQKYRTEPHPLGARPDDLLLVEAKDLDEAKAVFEAAAGPNMWALCMPPDWRDRDERAAAHFPGRRIRVEGPARVVFEVEESVTWRVSVSREALDLHFGADWPERIDAKDLWPSMGNDTEGFGWQLFEHIKAADEAVRAKAVVDARIGLERVPTVAAVRPSVPPVNVEEV